MAWLTLLAAGVLEIAFAMSLKPAEGFTRPLPSAGVIVFGTAAVVVLSRALHTIPVGTAYAVFTGIGAVGTVTLGTAVLGEPVSAARLGCIAVIVAGIVGLRITTPA